ncbi:transmembrane emp24 domain-containing protein 1-like [Convolutriloba macropyga]|uniref:transmembrane emp24 domain-containing protein 1-like n=1 Tax=Convolutriloba macropyga TaxID=536237 RepID=UPI003F51BFCC
MFITRRRQSNSSACPFCLDFCLFVVLSLLLFCQLCTAVDQSLGIPSYFSIVDPQSRSCYYEELIAGRTLEVEFDVFRGGNMDITFFIRAPNGEVVKHLPMKRSEYFDVEIQYNGVYEICLDNQFSRFAEKVVSLEYFDNKPMDDYDTAYDQLQGDADSLEMKVLDIFEAIDNVRLRVMRMLQYQSGRRSTESRDRYMMDATHTLVDRTSILSSILMVISTVGQIYLIRAMFKTPQRSSSSSFKSTYSGGGFPDGFPNMFSNGLGR